MQMRYGTPRFTGTGPQGHRGRMRGRLLANEAALADYEILEMLLFLGIPRRDTKPLAKSLINRFGTLADALAAAPDALGLPERAASALALVADSATHLARPERLERPTLDSWDALIRHIAPALRGDASPGLAALLLNSRNQLLAEPTWPGIPDPAGFPRAMLRHALEQHASAVLLVRHGSGRPRLTQADRTLFAAVQDAAGPLTVTLHDLVVTGQGGWTSLRQSGLC
jgi:DNA repair protein RadC